MKLKLLCGGLALSAALLNMTTGCSCSGGATQQLDEVNDDSATVIVSGEVVSDMIQNISSPVEMANEIKNSGVTFSKDILNPAGQQDKYETSFKRAVNLGVYSADLGYINTFNKNSVVVDYLTSIKRLADGIGVGQFLDFNTLSSLAKNSTNLDSLKQLSVSSFNNIDKYLREQKRSNVSTAIVVGTWVEGIHITGAVIAQTHDKGLTDRLGEQKNIVDIISIVVNTYGRSDSDFKALSHEIEKLKQIYGGVEVTTQMGDPITKEVDGMLVIEQNEITTVNITPEQVDAIINQVAVIRNLIIN
ncbi:hypothetical protein NP234_24405 [Salmonella enterica]|nr:hypothetical protein [Salmonella enterica]